MCSNSQRSDRLGLSIPGDASNLRAERARQFDVVGHIRGEGRSERGSAPVYVKFVAAVRLAQAEARASAEVTVRKMDPKWWLSRMHRDRTGTPGWTDKQQLEHTGEEGGPLVLKIISYKDQ